MIFFTRIAFDEMQETLTKAACSRAALRRSPAQNLVNSKQAACSTFFLFTISEIPVFFSYRAKKARVLTIDKTKSAKEGDRTTRTNFVFFWSWSPFRVQGGRGGRGGGREEGVVQATKKSKQTGYHARYPRKKSKNTSFPFSLSSALL